MNLIACCCLVVSGVPITSDERGDTAALARLAKGRVLVGFLQPGMTEKQMTDILGPCNGKLGVGTFGFLCLYSEQYGFGVWMGGSGVAGYSYFKRVIVTTSADGTRSEAR